MLHEVNKSQMGPKQEVKFETEEDKQSQDENTNIKSKLARRYAYMNMSREDFLKAKDLVCQGGFSKGWKRIFKGFS